MLEANTFTESETDERLPAEFGRYRLEKILGRGGMGTVFLAHDKELRRRVALKIPKFLENPPPNLLARFRREAQLAAGLSHPNICPVYDVGQVEGRHFICMGYVEGKPLEEFIISGHHWSEQQAALLIQKLATALHEAHQLGIVHRDLKPANIMVNHRNEPIIMDFGLSRHIDDGSARLTAEGSVVGTPAYMAPEQLSRASDLGPPIDIYSLGVVLYELLSGKTPFSGSVVSVISQVLHNDPVPIEQLRPDISPQMAAICRRALEKNPKDRFGSMNELAVALGTLIKGGGSSPIPAMNGTASILHASVPTKVVVGTRAIAETIVTNTPLAVDLPQNKIRSRILSWALLGALPLVCVLAAALFWGFFSHPGQFSAMWRSPAVSPLPNASPQEQFAHFDRNGDEQLDPEELALHIIHRADNDADEWLTFAEFEQAGQRLGKDLFAPPQGSAHRRPTKKPGSASHP
jgi:serine/threonine protein kinase